jgi:hypothetical protein
MMTEFSSPATPNGDLSVESDDPPIANIATGSRKKKRKNISAITPAQVGLGVNHLDNSDREGSPVSEGYPVSKSEAVYAEMKNIVGPELVTEIKQWSKNDPTKSQQFIIEQNGGPGFNLTGIPVDYVCFPVDKFLHLFEVFKCTKRHARHQNKFTLERYGYAQSLYYVCTNCEEKACIRANLTRELESKWKSEPPSKTYNNTSQHNKAHASMFKHNIKVYLATQQCGGGCHESKVLAGMFGLHSNPIQNSWMRVSENNQSSYYRTRGGNFMRKLRSRQDFKSGKKWKAFYFIMWGR